MEGLEEELCTVNFFLCIIFAFSRKKGRDRWEAMWSYQAQPSMSNKSPQIRATGGCLRVQVRSQRVTTPFIRKKGTTGNSSHIK